MGTRGAVSCGARGLSPGRMDGEVHDPEADALGPSCFCLLWGVEGKADRRRGVPFMASFDMPLRLLILAFA